jgi:uncharacterized protein (TIGR02217 family)
MTAVFPVLPGLLWDVKKRPNWSTRIQRSASGREVRAALFSMPLWDFDLAFEILRADTAHLELQQLMGFYLQQQGPLVGFYYSDPSDNEVIGQTIAIGDGVTTVFPFMRSMGGYIEPVGGVNSVANLYLSGARQTAGFTIGPSAVAFATPPATGAVVSADFSFYYLVRFADDALEFNNFMHQLWEAKSVKLKGYRP